MIQIKSWLVPILVLSEQVVKTVHSEPFGGWVDEMLKNPRNDRDEKGRKEIFHDTEKLSLFNQTLFCFKWSQVANYQLI